MSRLLVAYNGYGDLIAEAYSMDRLIARIHAAGYEVDDVIVGRVTA